MNIEWKKEDDENVMARLAYDDLEVTVVAVPRSALNGEDGPVIMPLMEPNERIIAFSDEGITNTIGTLKSVGSAAFRIGVAVGEALAHDVIERRIRETIASTIIDIGEDSDEGI